MPMGFNPTSIASFTNAALVIEWRPPSLPVLCVLRLRLQARNEAESKNDMTTPILSAIPQCLIHLFPLCRYGS